MSPLALSRRTLLTLAAAGCATPQTASTGGARIERDVVYVAGSSHPKHRLDVYLPGGVERAPIVVFLHGGYWISGDRRAPEHGPDLYENVGKALSRRGIVTVVPSYRLAPEVGIEAMLADVNDAIAWSRGHAAALGGSERLALVGHSAGGLLAALAACRKGSGIAAVGVLSGIWDVADMRARNSASFNSAVTTPVFGAGDADASWSPMTRLEHAPPRWLVAIAEDDFPYMIPQARAAHRALRALGREAELVRIAGHDHLDMVRRFGAASDPVVDAVARLAA
jgi:acetyl esterase/lipase